MRTVLGLIALAFALLVIVYVGVFGGIGVLLAERRGRTRMAGFAIGVLLGPIDWAVYLVQWLFRRPLSMSSTDTVETVVSPRKQGDESDPTAGLYY